MNFEWDPRKSEACFDQRGFDFAYALSAFADPNRIIQEDTRRSYGERRFQLIGRVGERLFVIVYTPRGQAFRLISARKANAREVKRYENGPNDPAAP